MRRRTLSRTAPLLGLALALAACSSSDAPPSAVPATGGRGEAAASALAASRDAAIPAQTPPLLTNTRYVAVSATGSVSTTPDTLTLSMGVRTQAPSANEALRDAATRADALIATLRGAGVEERDIQTTNLSIWPRYDNRGEQVVGYEASNTVEAKLRDLDGAGALIDAAAAAVGDAITLNGISFSVEDPTQLYAEARVQAVERARAQAEQLAAAAGAGVGQVLTIDESAQDVPPPVYLERAAADDGGGAATPIEPGQQTVRLTVQVVFELTS